MTTIWIRRDGAYMQIDDVEFAQSSLTGKGWVQCDPPAPPDPAIAIEAARESLVGQIIDARMRLTAATTLVSTYPSSARLTTWRNRLQAQLQALVAELKD